MVKIILNQEIRAIVVTVSDSRIEADDVSGAKLLELLKSICAQVSEKVIVSDDFDDLRKTLY